MKIENTPIKSMQEIWQKVQGKRYKYVNGMTV